VPFCIKNALKRIFIFNPDKLFLQKGRIKMAEQDTVKLLRECDAGIKMGVSSIDEVLEYVCAEKLRTLLSDCRTAHVQLQAEVQSLLDSYQDEGKQPNPIAKSMSWMKTNVKLAMKESDKTIADLMTDGCDMGVKSLNRYLNQYKTADAKSKDITQRLIQVEEQLSKDLRPFL
jgi:hypothetical protein